MAESFIFPFEILPEQYYLKLNEECTVIDEFKKIISDATWRVGGYLFVIDRHHITRAIYDDPFIKELKETFEGSYIDIYKFPPNSFYRFHTDVHSSCSINMVLEDYHSHSMFTSSKVSDKRYYDEITELKYEPYKWHLFNTQRRHCVLNLDNKPRYTIAYRFNKDIKNYTYEDVLEWYKKRSQ